MIDYYKTGSRKPKYQVDIMEGEIKNGSLSVTTATVSMTSEINSADADVKYAATISTTGRIWKNGKQTDDFMNWNKSRFKIWLIDGEVKSSLGVFSPQSISKPTVGSTTLFNVTGYDLSILAKNDCITSRLSLTIGTLYLDQIQSLLISCGITKIIADVSTATLQSTRDDWDIGTTKLKIVNQLLSEISFRSLEIDKTGTARLRRYESPSVNNIGHTYKDDQASIIESDTTTDSNLFEIPNIWVATVSNPDIATPLKATYINDNPLSETSTVYTGQNKVKVLTFDNIATQIDLQNAVNKQAFEDMQGVETTQFKTAVVADHGVNDTVLIQLPQYSGILVETAWEIDLDTTGMTHTGKKAVSY